MTTPALFAIASGPWRAWWSGYGGTWIVRKPDGECFLVGGVDAARGIVEMRAWTTK